MVEKQSVNITEAEAALYDRQIRLWGLDAQKRLRAAAVLLIGVGGLGAEVAKNIVLSGIKSLTLLDDRQVVEEDACSQFLVDRKDVGKNRAESSLKRTQLLNPMVEVTSDTESVDSKDDDYFTKFDVICATCCTREQLLRIGDLAHENNIMFFAGDVNGFYGYLFADLNEHEYAEEVKEKKADAQSDDSAAGDPPSKKQKLGAEQETKTVKKIVSFPTLRTALSMDWSTEENKKQLKRTPSALFIFRVLMEFRSKHGRDPSPKEATADRQTLLELRESVMADLKVDKTAIPEDFIQSCFAELSPVCAVTGGVLGQEIIKAVSQKDAPHRNFFFYNGVDGSGTVNFIG